MDTGLLSQPLPRELYKAQLLYQRSDGIYLCNPTKRESRKIADTGIYPRWLPDGKGFAFIRGKDIVLHDTSSGRERVITQRNTPPIAIAAHPDGRHVLYIEDMTICSVNMETGISSMLLEGHRFRELAVRNGVIAATVQFPLRGYGVVRFDLPGGASTRLGKGCSASLSPDGRNATVNLDGHRRLAIVDTKTGTVLKTLVAPETICLDNQHWANDTNWIAAVSEKQNILLQRVSDAAAWQVTTTGDGDRPDLFLP